MLKGNRLLCPALCATLALCLATSGVASYLSFRQYEIEHSEQRGEAPDKGASNRDEEVETWCFETQRPKSRQCATRSIKSQEDAKRAYYDLKAQQDMAKWAYALLLSSIAGIAISGVGLAFVAAGLYLNAQGNRQAREFFIAERRPWLNVTPKVSSDNWVLDGNVGRFHVWVEATNTGVSPATNVYFHIPESGLDAFTGAELDRFKATIARHKSEWSNDATGITIFPGSPLGMGGDVSIFVRNPEGGDFYVPVFVSYRFAGSEDVHVSPVVFRIGYASLGGGTMRRIRFQTLHHLAPTAD